LALETLALFAFIVCAKESSTFVDHLDVPGQAVLVFETLVLFAFIVCAFESFAFVGLFSMRDFVGWLGLASSAFYSH
jgi:hypothetical protein